MSSTGLRDQAEEAHERGVGLGDWCGESGLRLRVEEEESGYQKSWSASIGSGSSVGQESEEDRAESECLREGEEVAMGARSRSFRRSDATAPSYRNSAGFLAGFRWVIAILVNLGGFEGSRFLVVRCHLIHHPSSLAQPAALIVLFSSPKPIYPPPKHQAAALDPPNCRPPMPSSRPPPSRLPFSLLNPPTPPP
ncbi:hypothetical protein MA16_Dca021309 [Dendrobium catenatum]|uniref:Uncharacterized protein n=1 Tax=Dendrobium catenatum TaxID=906689 RepID=A0A2I0VYU6_9ASPA|nr:hypothetical protein MA16_Dca021309 [Dendrobium catenatum]